jgi:hypothetical protein
MNSKNEITEETIKVPSDMLIDIFSIILKEGLKHEVIQVLENRGIAVIVIGIDGNQSRQVKVFQNIRNLLSTYNEYRFSEEESFNWREN